MGTTAITVREAAGSVNPANVGGDPVESDSVNNHYWDAQENDILCCYNKGTGAVQVTLVSVADAQGRTGDDVKSIPAGHMYFFGPLKMAPWQQSDGTIYVDVDTDTDVEFTVLRIVGKT